MNEEERIHFKLQQTHQPNQRSLLVEHQKPNIFARIPGIFGNKSDLSVDQTAQDDNNTDKLGISTQ